MASLASQPRVGQSLTARYEALIRASQAIAAHRQPDELFEAIAAELRHVTDFDYLRLSLCDGTPGQRPRVFELPEISGIVLLRDVPREENIWRWVYEHQEAATASIIDSNTPYQKVTAVLRGAEIGSLCVLPLKTLRRRLGSLSIGSRYPDAYSEEEVRFLTLVADTVAVAIDDSLNIEASQRSRDRLRLLLDLMNRVISNLELRDVLRAIAANVRCVMQCDGTVISLHEPESNELRMYAIDFPESRGFAKEDNRAAADGTSIFAKAFQTGQPLTLNVSDVTDADCPAKVPLLEGVNTICLLPLMSRTRTLGVMGLARRQAKAFTQDDVDFLVQIAAQVAIAIENAVAFGRVTDLNDRLAQENLYLEDEIRSELNFREIVGQSTALRSVLKQVEQVAPTDSTVLIYGETGTGKELIARAVHNISGRRANAFVKLNCAAIPTGLLESELFGHEKGAFTGAIAQRIGRFELANGGSVFLDEIGDVPLELQSKLLRVLQEREFERLGSVRTQKTDARLIAATNCDLAAMVEQQKFRSDLFYRLNVFPIKVPPLRERTEDIPLLVRHFVQQFSRRMHKNIDTISSETMLALVRYDWPGNIRELQNVIERAVIVSDGSILRVPATDLKVQMPVRDGRNGDHSPSKTIRGVLDQVERDEILKALTETNWIVAGPRGAAARIGMKRSTLQLRMRNLGIIRPVDTPAVD